MYRVQYIHSQRANNTASHGFSQGDPRKYIVELMSMPEAIHSATKLRLPVYICIYIIWFTDGPSWVVTRFASIGHVVSS